MRTTLVTRTLKTTLLVMVVCALGSAVPTRATAQDPVVPDSLGMAAVLDSMSMMSQMMGPMMGGMMTGMMEAMLSTLERPETAEKLATFTRNYYEALVAKGFTETQALHLVAAVGFPSVGMGN